MVVRLASVLALAASLIVSSVIASAALALPETTAPSVLVKVRVTITDSKIIMKPRRAPRGVTVQFFLRNVGKKTRVFELGNAKGSLGLQKGFKQRLRPGQVTARYAFLDYRGALPYYGRTVGRPGRRMYGTFLIGKEAPG